MRMATLFLWVVVPAAAYVGFALYGQPYVIWSYSFEHNGDPFNPLTERHYLSCTFIGPFGNFTVPADAGRCGWIKFFQPVSDQ